MNFVPKKKEKDFPDHAHTKDTESNKHRHMHMYHAKYTNKITGKLYKNPKGYNYLNFKQTFLFHKQNTYLQSGNKNSA